jgi:hypothetical protein
MLGGTCNYTKAGNGIWYVEQYPHALDMKVGCVFVGLSSIPHNEGKIAFGWRVGYVDFGKARADAFWPAHDSEHALPRFDGLACDHKTFHGCLARGVGTQTARGLTAGYVAEDKVGQAVIGLELGGYLYEGVWRVDVTPYPVGQYKRQSWQAPIEWRRWRLTPYVGATLRYSYLMVMVRSYASIRAPGGLANGLGTQVVAGLSVPL